jgi:hypothetical protein
MVCPRGCLQKGGSAKLSVTDSSQGRSDARRPIGTTVILDPFRNNRAGNGLRIESFSDCVSRPDTAPWTVSVCPPELGPFALGFPA